MSRFINKKFQELEAYTPGEQPTDMKYIKLNTNESPFPPSQSVLKAISAEEVSKLNPDVLRMTFHELPFRSVEAFDYPAIARLIEEDGADVIWIALGAPKQDYFMTLLKPHLKRGVMIGVGAAFNFYSGSGERRAPDWMVRMHLEFVYRICQSPKKQLLRCKGILTTLPGMLWGEWRRKKIGYTD